MARGHDQATLAPELNRRLCAKLWNYFPGQWERIGSMAIIAYNQVHMANLCVAMSFSVNGVSQLHGQILKEDTFHDYEPCILAKYLEEIPRFREISSRYAWVSSTAEYSFFFSALACSYTLLLVSSFICSILPQHGER